jgi:hypothetical protein
MSKQLFRAAAVCLALGLVSLAAPPPKPVDHIEYMAWDAPTPRWSAKIAPDGKNFLCAPYGDWKQARTQNAINYTAQNGTEWSATIDGNRFVNAALGANISFESSEMTYRSWDGTAYSVQLDMKNKRFLQTAAPPSATSNRKKK